MTRPNSAWRPAPAPVAATAPEAPAVPADPVENAAAPEGEQSTGFDPARARKNAEARIAELNAQYLKVHKTLAPVAERRRLALETLDDWRDRLRVSLNRLSLSDPEVDAMLNDFIATALAEAPRS